MNAYLWHFVPVIIIVVAFYPTGVLSQPVIGSVQWLALRLAWWGLLTVVLVLLVLGVTAAERPMLRLPDGLGLPRPLVPRAPARGHRQRRGGPVQAGDRRLPGRR